MTPVTTSAPRRTQHGMPTLGDVRDGLRCYVEAQTRSTRLLSIVRLCRFSFSLLTLLPTNQRPTLGCTRNYYSAAIRAATYTQLYVCGGSSPKCMNNTYMK